MLLRIGNSSVRRISVDEVHEDWLQIFYVQGHQENIEARWRRTTSSYKIKRNRGIHWNSQQFRKNLRNSLFHCTQILPKQSLISDPFLWFVEEAILFRPASTQIRGCVREFTEDPPLIYLSGRRKDVRRPMRIIRNMRPTSVNSAPNELPA